MRILMTMPGLTATDLFCQGPDHMREPFLILRQRLADKGHALFTADESRDADMLLAWDVPPADIYAPFVSKRAVLIISEPPVVLPQNWQREVHQRFDAVLTYRDDWVDDFYRKFYVPMAETHDPVPDLPFEGRKLLVNCTSNKRSPFEGELYSERLRVIQYCQYHLPEDFGFYGNGWQGHKGWGGAPARKADVLPQYRFTLAYENCQHVPGYVTEKLFDAIHCGTAPVYWGAPNISDYVPASCFVDARQFETLPALIAYLRSMDETTWQALRDAGQAYLLSAAFKPFLPEHFVRTVESVLQ